MAEDTLQIKTIKDIAYQGIGTTENQGELYSGEHFSDYSMLLFIVDDSTNTKRASIYMPASVFANSYNTVLLVIIAGIQLSVSIKYVNNTKFKVVVTGGTPAVNLILKVYGE